MTHLLDRAGHPATAPRVRRSGWMVAALLVAALAVGGLAGRGLDLLPGLPFGTQTVDRSTPTLLTSLADLERYHAATGSFQVVVDLEKDVRWVPSAIRGERTTFLATGSVDAYVDFRGLSGSAVEGSTALPDRPRKSP